MTSPGPGRSGLSNEALAARVEQVKAGVWAKDSEGKLTAVRTEGAVTSTLTILALIYGNPSPQLANFQAQVVRKDPNDVDRVYNHRIALAIGAVLDAAMSDLSAGLTTSVRVRAKGEILGDFVGLARESLGERTTESDRVGAVLAAAALEETLKQLGILNVVDVHDRDMRGVIQKLKDAEVLVGAQSGIATGLVKFRDHAFHGQFDLIERPTTEAALAFVEGLLTMRMS